MKQVLMLLGTLVAATAGTVAHAQTLPPLERQAIPVSDVIREDLGPADYSIYEERGALPPRAIAALLDDEGYSMLSPPIRRGPAFVVAVIAPNGEDGRVTIDAFSGRIIRFRPVMGPGAMILPDDIGPTYTTARRELRPPRNIPYVSPRNPAPRAASRAQPSQAVQTGAGPAARPPTSAQAMMPASKPPVTLQPTQAMPPAIGFD